MFLIGGVQEYEGREEQREERGTVDELLEGMKNVVQEGEEEC